MELYEINIMKNKGEKMSDFSKAYIIAKSYFEAEKFCENNILDFVSINHIASEHIASGAKLYIPNIVPFQPSSK